VATTIPHFVAFEVGAIDALCRLGFLAPLRQCPLIPVVRMETVILHGREIRWRHETRGRRQ
jgi:hypothetical protein